MNEEIRKIISKYKMYMSFDENEYEMIQKVELNKLLDYIQQKENIIKEVREYIKQNEFYLDYKTGACIKGVMPLLGILDKESKK